MGRFIDEQAVIDCLTNTAKYYEREDADEWTKGIHYGLLHGLNNILDNVSPIEAIPKDQYEARLKADLKAILGELQLKITEKSYYDTTIIGNYEDEVRIGLVELDDVNDIIQNKINTLKEQEDEP